MNFWRQEPGSNRVRLVLLLLTLATLAAYWPATGYDFVNYDDPGFVLSDREAIQDCRHFFDGQRRRWQFLLFFGAGGQIDCRVGDDLAAH